MTLAGWGVILLFIALTVALAKPMGLWVYRLYAGDNMPLSRVLGPVERGFYRVAGIDPARDQSWVGYAVALVVFNVAGRSVSSLTPTGRIMAARARFRTRPRCSA